MTGPRRWTTTGSPPPPRPGPGTVAIAIALGVGPVFVQFHRLGYPDDTVNPTVIALVAAVFVAHRFPRWALPALIAAFGFVARAELIPTPTAAVATANAALWLIAAGAVVGRRRVTRPPVSWAALPGLLATAVLLVVDTGLRGPLAGVATAIAGVAAAAASPAALAWVVGRLEPALGVARRLGTANATAIVRIGRPLGVAVGAVAMLPAAVVSSIVWAGHRLARFDPLAPPAPDGSRWVVRAGPDAAPSRAAVATEVVGASPRGSRRVAAAIATALIVIVPATVIAIGPGTIIGELGGDDCNTDEADDPAMGADPGWPEIGCDTTAFASRSDFDAATVYTFPDFASDGVNQVDGTRRTWRAPECDGCRRLRVWWFGGSAAWGWWQRDEHTLPSQVAKWAAEEGIILDITNYATPGWVLGQSVRRFTQLTALGPAPDLVIFYDGGNDLNRQKIRNAMGRGTDESDTSFAEFEIDHVLRTADDPDRADATTTTVAPSEQDAPDVVAEHAVRRYLRGVDLATRMATSIGAEPVFLWQPLAPGSPASAASPDAVSPIDRAVWDEMLPAARALLPDTVVDLTDVYDGVDRPVFRDLFHTSEYGADLAARAVVERLVPTLRKLEAAPG